MTLEITYVNVSIIQDKDEDERSDFKKLEDETTSLLYGLERLVEDMGDEISGPYKKAMVDNAYKLFPTLLDDDKCIGSIKKASDITRTRLYTLFGYIFQSIRFTNLKK